MGQGQTQISVANQTFSLSFDSSGSGRLVRLNDGLEASFSSCECLLHLLEGVVGRRVWQTSSAEIVATLAQLCACA